MYNILNKNPDRFGVGSSIYCVWIRANDAPNAPLVAVWIDPQMRALGTSAEAACEQTETAASSTEALFEEADGHRSLLASAVSSEQKLAL